MLEITITTECARAVGRIADKHKDDPTASINITWREVETEQLWFVHVLDNKDGTVYAVDDETGVHAPLTSDERRRYDAGVSIFAEEVPA